MEFAAEAGPVILPIVVQRLNMRFIDIDCHRPQFRGFSPHKSAVVRLSDDQPFLDQWSESPLDIGGFGIEIPGNFLGGRQHAAAGKFPG